MITGLAHLAETGDAEAQAYIHKWNALCRLADAVQVVRAAYDQECPMAGDLLDWLAEREVEYHHAAQAWAEAGGCADFVSAETLPERG